MPVNNQLQEVRDEIREYEELVRVSYTVDSKKWAQSQVNKLTRKLKGLYDLHDTAQAMQKM